MGEWVLVFGGRDFTDWRLLYAVLDGLDIAELCHGAARGADFYAGAWAQERGVTCTAFPADWAKHGKAAGPIRNQKMLDEFKPTLAVGFPGGRGSADMEARVRRRRVRLLLPVGDVPPEQED